MQGKILNHETKLRISEKTKEDLKEVAEALGFKESDLTRLLLNQALHQIKQDAIKSGGFENLEILIRQT